MSAIDTTHVQFLNSSQCERVADKVWRPLKLAAISPFHPEAVNFPKLNRIFWNLPYIQNSK